MRMVVTIIKLVGTALLALSLVMGLLYGSRVYGDEFHGAPVDHEAIVINGVIRSGNILPLGVKLLQRSKKDSTVDLVINSPGGEVITGTLFVTYMEAAKANGATIRCLVPQVAASMAFQILVHCDERYTLDTAFLLWHHARAFPGSQQGLTADDAFDLGKQLKQVDDDILKDLYAALHIPKETVMYHFNHETLHTGKSLGKMAPLFIKTYKAIPGLLEVLNADVARSSSNYESVQEWLRKSLSK